VLNQAIGTMPKLTKQHRAALAVCFFVRTLRYAGPFDLSSFYQYVASHLDPFVEIMPNTRGDYRYLDSLGLGLFSIASTQLAPVFRRGAFGFFIRGFTSDQTAEEWRPHLNDASIFIPCLRDSAKLQINARSHYEVDELVSAKNIQSLAKFAATGQMLDDEVAADLISNVPVMAHLFQKWATNPALPGFSLTAVGTAVAHACQRQIATANLPLENFLA
jgi:hypothetical protein